MMLVWRNLGSAYGNNAKTLRTLTLLCQGPMPLLVLLWQDRDKTDRFGSSRFLRSRLIIYGRGQRTLEQRLHAPRRAVGAIEIVFQLLK